MLSCTASEEFTQKNVAEASAHTPLSPSEPSREHTARAEIPQGSTGGKFIYYLASETRRRVSAGARLELLFWEVAGAGLLLLGVQNPEGGD